MWEKRLARAAILASACLALIGCKDSAEDVSNSRYVLGLLTEAWQTAHQSCQAGSPNLEALRSVHVLLCQRVPRRVEKDYSGSDKQEVLAELQRLAEAYEAQVASKLVLTGDKVALRSGVAPEDVRSAFMGLEEDYRKLQAIADGD